MNKELYGKALNKWGLEKQLIVAIEEMAELQKEFDLLKELKGEKVKNALAWIRGCYDCYYKHENDENSPFEYLRQCAKGVER